MADDLNHTDIVNRLDRMQDHIDVKIDKLAEATGQNTVALATVCARHHGMEEWLKSIDGDVKELKMSDARHAGERGVWAALVNSPAVKWIMVAMAAAWLFITNGGSVAK